MSELSYTAGHQPGFFKYATWGGLFILALVVGFSYVNQAHGFGGHRGLGIEKKLEHMMDEVGVSDAQRTQIRSILDAQRPKVRAQHDQMRASRKALRELDPLTADYDVQVANLAAEVGQGTQEMVTIIAAGRKEIWQVLDEEQRVKAAELMRRHKARFAGSRKP